MRALLTILFLGMLSGGAHAQCQFNGAVYVESGFLKGQDLVDYSDNDLAVHVMGFVNGITLAPMIAAPESCAAAVNACVDGMNNLQMAAIVRKYLVDNPAQWHEGANIIVYRALFGCMLKLPS